MQPVMLEFEGKAQYGRITLARSNIEQTVVAVARYDDLFLDRVPEAAARHVDALAVRGGDRLEVEAEPEACRNFQDSEGFFGKGPEARYEELDHVIAQAGVQDLVQVPAP